MKREGLSLLFQTPKPEIHACFLTFWFRIQDLSGTVLQTLLPASLNPRIPSPASMRRVAFAPYFRPKLKPHFMRLWTQKLWPTGATLSERPQDGRFRRVALTRASGTRSCIHAYVECVPAPMSTHKINKSSGSLQELLRMDLNFIQSFWPLGT